MATQPTGGFWHGLRTVGRAINIVRLVIINLIFFFILALILIALNPHVPSVDSHSALLLKPDGQLVEQYSIDPASRALARMSGEETGQVQVRDLVRAINTAAKDNRIQRILLQPDHLQPGGFGALEEVGAALDRFRAAGKQVYVWSTGMDQGQYLLAVHADKILLDPQGALMITGLSNYRSYYKGLLDKLGVDAHLFRVGEFKSAAEPFILDAPSPASLEADKYWLGGLWDTWLAEVGKLRGIDPNVLRNDINNLPQEIQAANGDSAQLALKLHLVDGLATREQVVKLMQKLGAPADHGTGFRGVDMDGYLAQTRPDGFGKPSVAVIVAEGEIVGGKQPPGTIGGESTATLIRAARADRNVRAIVLRVNSPGGEVYAAEEIRREVQLAREAGKPVIVSMGDVAASGGYWISMDADRIFAEPDTITGSIGIFGLFFTVPNGLDKLGIHTGGVGGAGARQELCRHQRDRAGPRLDRFAGAAARVGGPAWRPPRCGRVGREGCAPGQRLRVALRREAAGCVPEIPGEFRRQQRRAHPRSSGCAPSVVAGAGAGRHAAEGTGTEAASTRPGGQARDLFVLFLQPAPLLSRLIPCSALRAARE